MTAARPLLLSLLAASTLLLVACTNPDDDDDVEFLAGSFACADGTDGPEWSFELSVSGPASDDGSRAYIRVDDSEDELVPMLLAGSNGDASRSFETTIDGTAAGEQPEPGDLPFSCADEPAALVRLCARDFGSAAELCFACDDGSGSPVPDGAVAWVDCD